MPESPPAAASQSGFMAALIRELLAPPDPERGWGRLWHSEDQCYGARGAAPLETEDKHGVVTWRIPAESATLLGCDAG